MYFGRKGTIKQEQAYSREEEEKISLRRKRDEDILAKWRCLRWRVVSCDTDYYLIYICPQSDSSRHFPQAPNAGKNLHTNV